MKLGIFFSLIETVEYNMDIYFYNGLICTSVKIHYNGNTKLINNVAIDTGAVESILSSKAVHEIGNISFKNTKMDFGNIDYTYILTSFLLNTIVHEVFVIIMNILKIGTYNNICGF